MSISLFTRQEKGLIAVCAVVQFSHIVDFMIIMPLGPTLMRLMQISPEQFGLLVSSYTFSAAISSFLAAFVLDKIDRKKALLFFYFGFSFGTFMCAAAPGYYWLLLARSLTGIFGGILTSTVLSIVSDSIDYNRRGTALGFVMGAFSVASIFGVPFGLLMANKISWHAPFIFLAAISVMVWILAFKTIPSMSSHLKGPHAEPPWHALTHILKSPHQIWALAFMFSLVMGHFSIVPFLSPTFVANVGLDERHIGYIYLLGGLVSMISGPWAGRLSDKYGKKPVFAISLILSLIPIFIITNMGRQPEWFLLIVTSSFFLTMSGRMVPSMAMVSASASPKYRGSFMSISASCQQMASAIASYIAGQMIVRGVDGRLLHYDIAGYIAMASSLLALLIVPKLKPTQ